MQPRESTPAQAAAVEYARQGWRIVPVPAGAKNPSSEGWPDIAWAPEDVSHAHNVGVILGPVSGDLVDIDLDSRAALELAPYFLPPTLTFGHESKRRSHWLYYAPGVRTQRLKFWTAEQLELIEIFSQNAASERCGHQTVFPGSTWTSKDGKRVESIDWDPDAAHDMPQAVSAGELLWAAHRLTVASIVIDGWGPDGGRNVKTMAYSSGLLAMGWAPDEVRDLFAAVFEVAGDDDATIAKNEGAIERTIAAFEAGTPTTGFAQLVRDGVVEQRTIKSIEQHGKTPARRAQELKLAKTKAGAGILNRLIAEAQDADRIVDVANEIAQLAAPLERALPEADAPAESRLGRVADLSEPAQPVRYVCPGLRIAPGKISAFGGYSGTGKGPLLDLFALCVASGRSFLGMPVERRKVGLLDFETGPIVELRLHRLAHALNIDLGELQRGGWLTLIHGRAPIDDEFITALAEQIEPGWVACIDSYTSAVPGDQNDSSIADAAFALGNLSATMGITVVVATHEKKEQQGKRLSDLQMVSGHNALTAAMQTAISLVRPDEDDKTLIEIRCARAPEEPFEPFRIRWVDVKRPDAGTSKGAQLKAEKWGLAATLEKDLTPEEQAVALRGEVTKQETELYARMCAYYPGGMQAGFALLLGAHTAKCYDLRRTALLNLVRSGRLLANFDWKREAVGVQTKRVVWLPGKGSEQGVVQT